MLRHSAGRRAGQKRYCHETRGKCRGKGGGKTSNKKERVGGKSFWMDGHERTAHVERPDSGKREGGFETWDLTGDVRGNWVT